MNITLGIAADVVLLIIILWKVVSGVRSGAVRMLGGLVSLGCGIVGGRLLSSIFAETVAERLLFPSIHDILNRAMDNLGVADLLENLSGILENANLPDFLKSDVLEQAAERLREAGSTAVTNAAEVIAQRLAGLILFLLGLVLVTLLVRVFFNGVLDPVISNLPILGGTNRLLGGLLGAAQGILLAGLLLFLVYRLLPSLSENADQILGEDSIEASFIVKQYFRALPGIFQR